MRLLVLLLLPLVRGAGLDTSICTPPVLSTASTAPKQPMRPQIPATFEVHVDCVIVNKNMTTMVHEHYDDVQNRGVAEQHAYGQNFKAYYDYKHNEFLGTFPDTGVCTVSNLSTSGERFLFGYTSQGGKGHIYTPSGALHFGANETEQYLGVHQVRGIWCQAWRSCQYWAAMKASMNVTWYFSDPNAWDTSLGIPQVPVSCHVIGRVQETAAKSHDFEHFYEFIHFRDFIENPRVFEMDANMVCPGRINTKPLPAVANVLSVMVETIDEVQKTVSFTSEWFDSQMKLTRFDMRPTVLAGSKYGPNRLTIVRDFNTGIQYVKDQLLGNCTVVALTEDNWDDRMQDPQHLRIVTAQEFFHFDKTYSYTGIKTIRGVDCDTWISRRTDFPPNSVTNSTWEWAFVSKNWTSGYDKATYSKSAIPFQLKISIPAFGVDYTTNMFQYNAVEPSVMTFDITNCMATERRRSFKIAFTNSYTQVISQHISQVKYAALNAIVSAATVSPLRVANLMINIYNQTAHLNFDLTDLPPVKGDVINDNTGVTLDLAASQFIQSVHAGSFQINAQINNKAMTMKPVVSSLVETTIGPTPFVTRHTFEPNQLDTSVCTPLVPSTASTAPRQPMRPQIPATFEVHVDCVIVNKNMTTMVHEHYDDVQNRGVAEQHGYGQDFKAYYDYKHNEFIGMYPHTGQCSVTNLSTSGQRFLFGYTNHGGKGHIYTPSGALHFGANETEQYLGLSKVRGIWCQSWRSCQYWADMKATMNVTWYFSDPNSWNTALGIPQVPVRCHVIGRVQDSAVKSHAFEHFYEFIHFRDFIEEPHVFEMNDGIVCPGRINTKPLPNVADVISILVEQIDEVQKTVTFTSEWFDSRMGLTRFDMKPAVLSASKYGTNRLTVVRDFNTGIQYTKDQLRGNCSVSALSQDNWDDRMQDPQHVRIATAQEFFHFDNTYSYTGIKTVRGVDCDTWISLRNDTPPGLGVNSTWQWAFVNKNWTSGYDNIPIAESAIPFQLRVQIPAFGVDYTMNMFQYNGQEPSVMNFDITNCMATERRRSFRIAFPQQYTQLISQHIPQIKYASLNAIMGAASVSPLRVANLMINMYNQTAHLNFDLTDLPPVKGDVISDNTGLPLDLAATTFLQSVKGGGFQLIPTINNKDVYITPLASTLVEMTAGPTPFVTRSTSPPFTLPPQAQTTKAPQTVKQQTPQTVKPQTNPPVTPKPQITKPRTSQPQRTSSKPVVTQKQTVPHFTLGPKSTPTTWSPYVKPPTINQFCGGSASGYSAGVMAGVAVVMVVFGGAGGSGLALFLSRKRRI